MEKKVMFALVILVQSFGINAAEFKGVNLTSTQCEDWKVSEYIQLTKANEKLVSDSCRKRYTSENALGNCTAFEGEDLIKHLKKQAKVQCK